EEIDGKTVRVVELERRFAGKRRAAPGAHALELFAEDAEPALERLAEANLLLLGDVGDEPAPLAQLAVVLAHEVDDLERHFVEERTRDAEAMPMADGAAHDPAQHVIGARAIGQNAVGDQKRRRAR